MRKHLSPWGIRSARLQRLTLVWWTKIKEHQVRQASLRRCLSNHRSISKLWKSRITNLSKIISPRERTQIQSRISWIERRSRLTNWSSITTKGLQKNRRWRQAVHSLPHLVSLLRTPEERTNPRSTWRTRTLLVWSPRQMRDFRESVRRDYGTITKWKALSRSFKMSWVMQSKKEGQPNQFF